MSSPSSPPFCMMFLFPPTLYLLCRLSWFLPPSLLLIYLKSYVLPYFDYCDVVWSSCTQEESRWLESLLNFGCKTVLRRKRDSSSTAALKVLGLTTLTLRRKLHTAQLVFRCLSSKAPSYLSRLFSSPSTYCNTRSCTTHQLNLPALKTSLGQRAFSFAGASLWRSLPPSVRCSSDSSQFCKACLALFSNT